MTDTTSPVSLPVPVATEQSGSQRQNRRLNRILCLDDFEPAARKRLPRPLFGYIAGASETNSSLADNRLAFSEYGFRPRVLTDVSRRSQVAELFGIEYASPFGIAPMGISALMAYRGDIVLASAAREANIPMIMSGSSLIPLEKISTVAPNSWFQAYLPGEPERINALLDRVAAAGFKTLVLTVDVATLPSRENNVRTGFSTPLRPSARLLWEGASHPSWLLGTFVKTIVRHGIPHFENSYATRGAPIVSRSLTRDFGKRDHLNWRHLEQIRQRWKGRLIVKGIMRVDDAAQAAATGVDGVIVSNHGGRQLDYTASPLRVLSGIVEAVGHSTVVMIDGGIRRGTDVMKALALGAKFVFIGRPFLYAAGIGGQTGVAKAIDLLSKEIHQDMALLGVNTLGEITPDLLIRI